VLLRAGLSKTQRINLFVVTENESVRCRPVIMEHVFSRRKSTFLDRDLTEMPLRTGRLLDDQLLYIAEIYRLNEERADLKQNGHLSSHG